MTGFSIPGLGGAAEQAGIEAADATRRAVEDFLGLRKPAQDDAPRCSECRGVRLVQVRDRLWCPYCTRGFKP